MRDVDVNRTIGLIGGMSWESSALYYRVINETSKERRGGHSNVSSLMLTLDFGVVERLQREGGWDELGAQMAAAARQLAAGGAGCIVLCTNTMHKLAARIEAAVEIPLLHIADPTGAALRGAGHRCIGLLGTRFTMEQDFYRRRLEERFDLEVLVPEAADRDTVHRIIYDELCHGRRLTQSRSAYQRIIDGFAAHGAQAVILGCTEITLLIGATDSSLPVFDTTRLHAEAAVDWAMRE